MTEVIPLPVQNIVGFCKEITIFVFH